MMDYWPKHPDGTPKKIGEMAPAERSRTLSKACAQLQREFEDPRTQEKLSAFLRGENVRQ